MSSIADCSTVAAVAVRASCAWSLPPPSSVHRVLGRRCCVLCCAFSPLRFCNTISGRVGSGQPNTYRAKKTRYSAMTVMAMAATMALPYATRNATAIWWRFFEIPRRHSAIAPPWPPFNNTDIYMYIYTLFCPSFSATPSAIFLWRIFYFPP